MVDRQLRPRRHPDLSGQRGVRRVEAPLRRPEAFVAADPAAVPAGHRSRQSDGVAFHHQVKIHARRSQQQVAHEPTDDVQRVT